MQQLLDKLVECLFKLDCTTFFSYLFFLWLPDCGRSGVTCYLKLGTLCIILGILLSCSHCMDVAAGLSLFPTGGD